MIMEKQFTVVNNFEHLSKYFDILKSPEDFYYIQVIQRKKDGHRKSERIIKNFYIYNKEEFLKSSYFLFPFHFLFPNNHLAM